MANVRPANYTAPEQADFLPSHEILAADTQKLLNASNWIEARGLPLVNQHWNRADAIFYRNSAAFARNCRWRIPGVGQRTDVRCVLYAEHPVGGGGAEFRFWSENVGGFSAAVAVPAAAAAAVFEVTLTCDFSADGWDEIQLSTHGDGVNPIRVHSVHVMFPVLGSPLADPTTANPVTPYDENEQGADEALAADHARTLRANLVEFLARVRVHYNWSGLENVSSGALADLAMPEYPHNIMALTLAGRAERGFKGQVHAYAINTSGADDQYVYMYGSSPDASRPIVVPASVAAAQWFDPTVAAFDTFDPSQCERAMDEAQFLGGQDWRSRFEVLSVVPHTEDEVSHTTAQVRSIACWSV